MICLDCDAAIAAFQKNPPAHIAVYRDRVHAFLDEHRDQRLVFPTVALSEYLWKADRPELEAEIMRVIGKRMIPQPFDDLTAEISAKLGRDYAAGGSLGAVAKRTGHDRIALKADLLIVSTALQIQAQFFVTGNDDCYRVATHAKLPAVVDFRTLPTPAPKPPPPPPAKGTPKKGLFDDVTEDT